MPGRSVGLRWPRHGCRARRAIEELNEKEGSMRINGVKATFLRKQRNPSAIEWRDHGVELVVDATGAFLDPTVPADDPKVRQADITRARKLLGWEPKVPAEEGLRRAIADFRQRLVL